MQPWEVFKAIYCHLRAGFIFAGSYLAVFSSFKGKMTFYLFAIVGDWRQDGSQGLESHRDVKEVSSKKKVVIVSQHRHGHIPG